MSVVTIDDLAESKLSLRRFLRQFGVTDEATLDKHIQFILDTEGQSGRRLDLRNYVNSSNNLNSFPPNMG